MRPTSSSASIPPSEAPVYVAGGTVQAGGGVYLARPADRELLELCRAGAFAFILTSRQMGKSSLMVRTAEALLEEGVRSIIVDLTGLGAEVTRDQWYKGLLLTLEDQLGLATSATRWWQEHEELGIPQRFNLFLRRVVLAAVPERIVVFIDEIDTTLRLGFTDDFFTSIRYLYHARADSPELARLSFVLIGVATPGDLIKDPERTPFNIGQRVELTDFTLEETRPLLDGLPAGLPAAAPAEQAGQVLESVHTWTGGHPYLTLRVFRSLAEEPLASWSPEAVEQRIAELFFGAMSDQDSNLQFVRDMLTKKAPDPAAVLTTYRDVRRGKQVRDEELSLVKSWLKLSGVVRREDGLLRVRNRIYASVFTSAWVGAHLEVDWARVLVRVGRALLLYLLIGALPLALYAWWQKENAEEQAAIAEEQGRLAEGERQVAEAKAKEAQEARAEALRQKSRAEESEAKARAEREIAEQLRGQAEHERGRAVLSEAEARSQKELAVSRGLAAQAAALRRESPDLVMVSSLLAAEALDRSAESPGAAQILYDDLPILPQHLGRLAVKGVVTALSPDGARLLVDEGDATRILDTGTGKEVARLPGLFGGRPELTNDGRRVVGNVGTEVVLWDAATGREVKRIARLGGDVVRWTIQGKYRVSWEPDILQVWDLATGEATVETFAPGLRIVSLPRVNASGTHVLLADPSDRLQVRDLAGSPRQPGETWDAAKLEAEKAISADLSPDGNRLVLLSPTGIVEVWDRPGIKAWQKQEKDLDAEVLFGKDPTQVLVRTQDTVHLWSTTDDRKVAQLHHESPISTLWLSGDRSRLVTVTEGKVARIWHADSGRELARLVFEDDFVFNLDASRFVTVGQGTAELWQTGGRRSLPVLPFSEESFQHADMSEDFRRLAAATRDGDLHVWDVDSGRELVRLSRGRSIRGVRFGGRDRLLLDEIDAEGSNFGAVIETSSGRELAQLPLVGPFSSTVLSPDGRWLVTARLTGIEVREIPRGHRLAEVAQGEVLAVDAIELSRDGRRIAIASGGTVRVRQVPSGKLVLELRDYNAGTLAWSSDGGRLATASSGTVSLWDAETGKKLRELESEERITALTFSLDGQWLGLGTRSGASVWEVATGRRLAQLVQDDDIQLIGFSEDGRRIITLDESFSVDTRPWRSSDLIAEVCRLLQRDLTPEQWREYLGDEPYRETCTRWPRE